MGGPNGRGHHEAAGFRVAVFDGFVFSGDKGRNPASFFSKTVGFTKKTTQKG